MNKSTGILPALLLLLLLSACDQTPVVDRIRTQGILKVATTNGATTLYEGSESLAGFEYELVNGFARHLNIPVEFILYNSETALLDALSTNQVHMIAAGLTATEERAHNLALSTPYQDVEQKLLYRRGSRKPKSLADLQGALFIPEDSSYQSKLSRLQQTGYPDLKWHVQPDGSNSELLARLNAGEIEYTLVDSDEFAVVSSYYPHVRAAFSLPGREQLTWGFSAAYDNSLQIAANTYLNREAENGNLEKLRRKYYSNLSSMSFVDNRDFWRHVESRLPKYEALFKEAAAKYELDWRLLAAIGYQESHWDKDAISPTGVKGIMMLTKAAARELDVQNRSDPIESILGGARYILWNMERIPERIKGKDRLWFGLASYNIGYGHLEDARVLTQKQGGNPDLWEDVKQRLPLLSMEKYYQQSKHGYARGGEPVVYVRNIRHYYRLLIWHSNQQKKHMEEISVAGWGGQEG